MKSPKGRDGIPGKRHVHLGRNLTESNGSRRCAWRQQPDTWFPEGRLDGSIGRVLWVGCSIGQKDITSYVPVVHKRAHKLGYQVEHRLADTAFHYFVLIKRAITGIILGAIAGAIQVWFFKRDLMHLWAAIAGGAVYMTTWVVFTDWLRLAGGKILLGGVSGVIAAIVWWSLTIHAEDAFIQAAVAGLCFGAAYAWSDQRMA